jgi:uncharacterized membrane protein YkvA (DUF1232 family)
MTLKERAKKLKTDIPAVFIALKHPKTPWYAKVMAALTVAYALSPIDLVPDFVPVLGYLDDVLILPAMVVLTVKFIPKEVYRECQSQAEGIWSDGKPKRWYYAIPIAIIWLLLIGVIAWCFLR